MLFDDGIPRHRTMTIPDAVYRCSSIFLGRSMFGGILILFVCALERWNKLFHGHIIYCYCSRRSLTNQGTNLGKVPTWRPSPPRPSPTSPAEGRVGGWPTAGAHNEAPAGVWRASTGAWRAVLVDTERGVREGAGGGGRQR